MNSVGNMCKVTLDLLSVARIDSYAACCAVCSGQGLSIWCAKNWVAAPK